MKRVSALLCCLGIILAGSGLVAAGDHGAAGAVRLRLFYLYAPDQSQQVERLARWQKASSASVRPFDVVGVAWPRAEHAPQGEWAVPDPIVERAVDGGDYAALVYPDARIHSQGRGSEMERVVRALTGAHVSTDVDESTWGKIKELFH